MPPEPKNPAAPLIGFSEANAQGDRRAFELGYHRDGTEACISGGKMMRSFLLRKGHLLTAGITDGYLSKIQIHPILKPYPHELWNFRDSNVYIANTKDLKINLGSRFAGKVNWIRVAEFRVPIKRGMCTNSWNRETRIQLKPGWFYHWALQTNDANPEEEYVSMLALPKFVTNDFWKKMLFTGQDRYNRISHMLGFNEPDMPNKAKTATKMSLEEVMGGWPLLLQTGARLGSPSCLQNAEFLGVFMAEAKKRGYRVDFIGAHWYDWPAFLNKIDDDSAPEIFERFKSKMTEIHNTYNLPIWVTEFNINDRNDMKLHEAFLNMAIPWMEKTPWIERYAWYEGDSERFPATQFWGDKNRTRLNRTGEVFSGFASTASFIDEVSVGQDRGSSHIPLQSSFGQESGTSGPQP